MPRWMAGRASLVVTCQPRKRKENYASSLAAEGAPEAIAPHPKIRLARPAWGDARLGRAMISSPVSSSKQCGGKGRRRMAQSGSRPFCLSFRGERFDCGLATQGEASQAEALAPFLGAGECTITSAWR